MKDSDVIRQYIMALTNCDNVENQQQYDYTKEKMLAENIKTIGVDRLALSLQSRSDAEMIIENSNLLLTKIMFNDKKMVGILYEALQKISEKISNSEYINTNEKQILKESIFTPCVEQSFEKEKILERFLSLSEQLEMKLYKDNPEVIFNEGVEMGFFESAQMIRNIVEEIKNEKHN